MKKLILSVAIAAMVLDVSSVNAFSLFSDSKRELAENVLGEGHSPWNNNKTTRNNYYNTYGDDKPIWFEYDYLKQPAAQILSSLKELKTIVDSLDTDSGLSSTEIKNMKSYLQTLCEFTRRFITLADRITYAQKESRRVEAYTKLNAKNSDIKKAFANFVNIIKRHPDILSGDIGGSLTPILENAALGYGVMLYALNELNVMTIEDIAKYDTYMSNAFLNAGLTNDMISSANTDQKKPASGTLKTQITELRNVFGYFYQPLISLLSGNSTTTGTASQPAVNTLQRSNSTSALLSTTSNAAANTNTLRLGTGTLGATTTGTAAFNTSSTISTTTPTRSTTTSTSRSSSRSTTSRSRGSR